jgi:hypothetical protein
VLKCGERGYCTRGMQLLRYLLGGKKRLIGVNWRCRLSAILAHALDLKGQVSFSFGRTVRACNRRMERTPAESRSVAGQTGQGGR